MKRLALILLVVSSGAFAQSHSVTLTWSPSADAAANPTLTYNVYRASGPCTGTPSFAKIDSTAAGVLTFTDTSVAVGQTFCYEVTSVLNGLEGSPSNNAQAQIFPAPPSLTLTSK